MTASTHRRTCDQLGACQTRAVPCAGCHTAQVQRVGEACHASAQALRQYTANFRPYPATVPQLQVQETEADRVRRVLAPKGCQHDCSQARACTCAFGVCDEACSGWAGMAAPRPPATKAAPADPSVAGRPRDLPHVPQPARDGEPEPRHLTYWFCLLFGMGVGLLISGLVLLAR